MANNKYRTGNPMNSKSTGSRPGERNPNNKESPLYTGLTRLFSGPLSSFRAQSQIRYKRRDLDRYKFTSASGQNFKKKSYNPFEAIQSNIMANQSRAERYSDFDQMEFSPEIASALDIYSDEMTTSNQYRQVLIIDSKNEEIKSILQHLYFNILNVETNLFSWCRTMVKFGDFFLYLDIDEKTGIKKVLGLPTPEVERLEGEDESNPNYVQFQWNSAGITFENWQIAHFRILGQDKYSPYGTSVLEPARRIWRQLNLMEDAMMAYRIVRSPERRVFYIDVGNVAPSDVEQYVQKIVTQMKRNQIVDPHTGRVDLRYNPMPVHKDTYIPLLDGRTVTIEQLAKEQEVGKQNWVYSVQDGTHQVVPGKIVWCGKNYTADKMIKIWLDNSTYLLTAPEHPFVLRDGTSCRADELKQDDALMPFYRQHTTNGYEKVYNPKTEKFEFTHRLVAENIYPKKYVEVEKPTVHHKDVAAHEANKLNNAPDNLEVMNFFEHRKMHAARCKETLFRPETRKKVIQKLIEYNSSPEKRVKTIELNKKLRKAQKMGEAYNSSPLHKEHNTIRKAVQLKSWKANKPARRRAMEWAIPDECIEIGKNIFVSDPTLNREDFINHFKKNEMIAKKILDANIGKKKKIELLSRTALERKLKSLGYHSYGEYKKTAIEQSKYLNHKVVRIETVYENADVYCMTVEGPSGENDRHNFAARSALESGFPAQDGVFVKNSVEEDFYIPVRGTQSGTKIDTLKGGEFTGDIDDIQYLRDKLFSALKVPQSYLARGKDGQEDKSTLAQKDIRFARTIQRLQRVIVSELEKIGIIHLYTLGYRNEDLLKFKLRLNNPSKISDLQELEHFKSQLEVAAAAKENGFSKRWVYENVFKINDNDFQRIQRDIYYDKQFERSVESGEATDTGTVGGSTLNTDLGMAPDGAEVPGPGEPGGEEGDAGESGIEPAVDGSSGEEETLLAAPGRRNDGAHLTKGSNGKWYKPTNHDGRQAGARSRHMSSTHTPESVKSTYRNLFAGSKDLSRAGAGIFNESEGAFERDEKLLLDLDNKLQLLSEKLLRDKEEKDKKAENKPDEAQ